MSSGFEIYIVVAFTVFVFLLLRILARQRDIEHRVEWLQDRWLEFDWDDPDDGD